MLKAKREWTQRDAPLRLPVSTLHARKSVCHYVRLEYSRAMQAAQACLKLNPPRRTALQAHIMLALSFFSKSEAHMGRRTLLSALAVGSDAERRCEHVGGSLQGGDALACGSQRHASSLPPDMQDSGQSESHYNRYNVQGSGPSEIMEEHVEAQKEKEGRLENAGRGREGGRKVGEQACRVEERTERQIGVVLALLRHTPNT